MEITWFGHAAFLLEAGGVRVILDPYRSPDSGGYLPINVGADLVVTSHENDRYHSHLGQILPPFEHIRGEELVSGGLTRRGIHFRGIPVFETPAKLVGDEVAIVHFAMDGLRLAFLGDLGHALTPDEVAPIAGSDIVFLAAGGPPTIDFPLIPDLLAAIGPRVVIPMHDFLSGKINLPIGSVERLYEVLPDWPVERVEVDSWNVTRESLPDRPTIVRLRPTR